ncbi:hypothetical protein H6P81_012392 [Aristolochia fimbriata]|uniref:CCHC-type domain-containing protein n=1 Tax=Aristolochia fimbriata TaxID=158543 RepID=A0AAV7EC83_ARIFI|nr:hypothetical protein H6P81_012392 [Aristolochia fimbriata]
MKRVAIEEYKVIDNMTLDELIGSLKTFEMDEESEDSAGGSKKESVALQSLTKEESVQLAGNHDVSTTTLAELDEKMSLLAKGLNKFIRKNKKKSYLQGDNRQNNGGTGTTEVAAKRKVVVCYECGGKGHIQSDCPTYLRKQKSFSAAWSDDESSESGEDECNFVAFTAKLRQKLSSSAQSKSYSISTNSKEDIDDEDGDITVENIIQQWDGVLESTKILREQIGVLEKDNEGRRSETRR